MSILNSYLLVGPEGEEGPDSPVFLLIPLLRRFQLFQQI